MNENYKHSEITKLIIKAFYNVYNQLGFGFLEKVYENSMLIEMKKLNLSCKNQYPIKVHYDEKQVGEYFADILVEDNVIIELKAADAICKEHEAQLVNYLKATDKEVGILLKFGKEPQFKRKVFSKEYKNKSAQIINDHN
jgi:GxxExxY protein